MTYHRWICHMVSGDTRSQNRQSVDNSLHAIKSNMVQSRVHISTWNGFVGLLDYIRQITKSTPWIHNSFVNRWKTHMISRLLISLTPIIHQFSCVRWSDRSIGRTDSVLSNTENRLMFRTSTDYEHNLCTMKRWILTPLWGHPRGGLASFLIDEQVPRLLGKHINSTVRKEEGMCVD